MKKIPVLLSVFFLMAFVCFGCGNSKTEQNASVAKNEKLAEKMDVTKKYRDLSEWEGRWESFINYCDKSFLNVAWDKISKDVNIDVDKLKDTFSELCFIADDVKYFEIKENKITGYDSNNKEVFSHEYTVVDEYDAKSDKTVIEGEKSYLLQAKEEAGRFNYICIMPICSMEQGKEGMEMIQHFHFNYGANIEQATNRDGIPTMVENDAKDEEKVQTLLTFFMGTQNED